MENSMKTVKNSLQQILDELQLSASVSLEKPMDQTHGDFTSNVSFQLARHLQKSPIQAAEMLAQKLEALQLPEIKKVEAVAPGFINIWLSEKYLISRVEDMIRNQDNIGRTDNMHGEKISVEFTDPNPFKEFHIGHLYSNTVGESISRLLESQGAIVWRADYFGDVGMHVAKSLWGLEQKFHEDNMQLEDLAAKPLSERIKYLGQAYAKGATAFEEDQDVAEETKAINRLVFLSAQKMWEKEKGIASQIDYKKDYTINQEELQNVYDMYTTGRRWSLEYFDSIYTRLGMKFDGYYPESIAGERGYKLVKEHIADGVFIEHDGAIIFKGEQYGLHTRVFINSLGFPTYEAKELGLAPWKYEEFPYDQSIIITGNEINEYFKVLIAAMLAVEPDLGKKTKHISHGMVRLPQGKMSSRTGKILTGEWLLDEAVNRAYRLAAISGEQRGGWVQSAAGKSVGEIFQQGLDKTEDLLSEEKRKTVESVGIGAIKYAFLRQGIGKDIEFDFDSSLSFEGNSGPYIQYSFVRTQSILEKAPKDLPFPTEYMPNTDEYALLRKIAEFDFAIAKAAENLAPSMVCTYLFELAKTFSYFYQQNRIVDAKDKKEVAFRVNLTAAVGAILRRGLFLLGIAAPKRM